MSDDFLGVGLGWFEGSLPPTIENVAEALRAIEELAAATELIREARGQVAQMMAIAKTLLDATEQFDEVAKRMRYGAAKVADTLAAALQGDEPIPVEPLVNALPMRQRVIVENDSALVDCQSA